MGVFDGRGTVYQLTIPDSQIPATKNSYLVDLYTSAFTTNIFNGNGQGLRFATDEAGDNGIPIWLVYLDDSDEDIHVKVLIPTLNSAVPTIVYYAFDIGGGSQPGEGDVGGKHAATTNYNYIHEFSDDPSVGVGALVDGSANSNDGESKNMEAGDLIGGPVDGAKAWALDGINEEIIVNDSATTEMEHDEDFIYGLILRIPSTNQPDTTLILNGVMIKFDGNSGSTPYWLVVRYHNQTSSIPGQMELSRWDTSVNPQIISGSVNRYDDDAWHLLIFNKNSSTFTYYNDDSGTKITTTDTTTLTTLSNIDTAYGNRIGVLDIFFKGDLATSFLIPNVSGIDDDWVDILSNSLFDAANFASSEEVVVVGGVFEKSLISGVMTQDINTSELFDIMS